MMRHSLTLSDCSKLYENSESRLARLLDKEAYMTEDDRTWMSVLANHWTCLDGLGEEGHAALDAKVFYVNFTYSLGHALCRNLKFLKLMDY